MGKRRRRRRKHYTYNTPTGGREKIPERRVCRVKGERRKVGPRQKGKRLNFTRPALGKFNNITSCNPKDEVKAADPASTPQHRLQAEAEAEVAALIPRHHLIEGEDEAEGEAEDAATSITQLATQTIHAFPPTLQSPPALPFP